MGAAPPCLQRSRSTGACVQCACWVRYKQACQAALGWRLSGAQHGGGRGQAAASARWRCLTLRSAGLQGRGRCKEGGGRGGAVEAEAQGQRAGRQQQGGQAVTDPWLSPGAAGRGALAIRWVAPSRWRGACANGVWLGCCSPPCCARCRGGPLAGVPGPASRQLLAPGPPRRRHVCRCRKRAFSAACKPHSQPCRTSTPRTASTRLILARWVCRGMRSVDFVCARPDGLRSLPAERRCHQIQDGC